MAVAGGLQNRGFVDSPLADRHFLFQMAALHIETPTIKSDSLTALTGVDVYLKLDTLQPSGMASKLAFSIPWTWPTLFLPVF